jgi:hypothetical protein
MKNEKEYKQHVKDAFAFATEVAGELNISNTTAVDVIFGKVLTPYHYFEVDNDTGETVVKPTVKQIEFAKQLNIENPESYSRKELSKKIQEATTE